MSVELQDLLNELELVLGDAVLKAIGDENLDSPVWSAALTVSSDREECLPPWLHICTEEERDNFIFEDNLPQYLWIPPSYKTLISLLADDDSLKLSGDIDDILDQQELDIEDHIMPVISKVCRKLNSMNLPEPRYSKDFFIFGFESGDRSVGRHIERDVPTENIERLREKFGMPW